MALSSQAAYTLAQETQALLARLSRVKPFALIMPRVPAASISPAAAGAVERHLRHRRLELRARISGFQRWLRGQGRRATPAEAQRRFAFLKLKYNAVLTQLDIFADVLTQRCEHENGVWLAGLDAAADDALTLNGRYYAAPSLVTYLDRGHGAAIRRARTRLPGGGRNPVAVIRIPRERMVGSGIASSLVHEVGHQGAALLDLVESLRPVLRREQELHRGERRLAWQLWERWISESVADFWSLAKLGVAATQGLMGVVSLPRAFVFRVNTDDPHPFPWIRVKLSVAMGQALYPHRQWAELARLWDDFYPPRGLGKRQTSIVRACQTTLPRFVQAMVSHRPRALGGGELREVFPIEERQPAELRDLYGSWGAALRKWRRAPPTLAFAVLGQARQDRAIRPEDESRLVADLLNHWALARASAPIPRQRQPIQQPETERAIA